MESTLETLGGEAGQWLGNKLDGSFGGQEGQLLGEAAGLAVGHELEHA